MFWYTPPLETNTIYNYNGTKYYVEGWYYDNDYTSKWDDTDVITQDTTLYAKLVRILENITQEYYISTLSNEFTYINNNIHFYDKNNNEYKGIVVDALGNISYLKMDNSYLSVAPLGLWVSNDYRYIKFVESILPIELDIDILDGGGYYCYDIEYVTNNTQTISKKTFIHTLTASELPSLTPTSPLSFLGWYYDSLFTQQANVGDILSRDVTLYGKFGDLTSINITLYQNVDANNRINKSPVQKALISGVFKDNTSIMHPSIIIDYDKLDFNYVYIDVLNRYYYVDDIIVINKKLKEIRLSIDVLMTYRKELMNIYGLVKRNEDRYNPYLYDERDVIENGCDITFVDASGGTDISSTNDPSSQRGNIVLMGVK